MSDETARDDAREAEVLERLLDDLGSGAELAPGPSAPGEPSARREYLELLGLIGAAVTPRRPPEELRERLLAAVADGGAASAAAAAPAAPQRRWALPLAASLALALAGFSGWQAAQLAEQRSTIAALAERLAEVEARTQAVAALRDQLATARDRLAFVTRSGVELCALRPMAAETRAAGSRGVLYVAADHQHWYLTIDNLHPCKQGRSYQLWFVPEEGSPVSAGTFDVREGVRVELSSDTMPAATRAVTVTLEPAGGSESPTGPAVLHGDEVMAVL